MCSTNSHYKDMKPRYFTNGREISEKEAKEIKAENNRLMTSGNMADMLKIQFIQVMNNPQDWN